MRDFIHRIGTENNSSVETGRLQILNLRHIFFTSLVDSLTREELVCGDLPLLGAQGGVDVAVIHARARGRHGLGAGGTRPHEAKGKGLDGDMGDRVHSIDIDLYNQSIHKISNN